MVSYHTYYRFRKSFPKIFSYRAPDATSHNRLSYRTPSYEVQLSSWRANGTPCRGVERRKFFESRGTNKLTTFSKSIIWTEGGYGASFLSSSTSSRIRIYKQSEIPSPRYISRKFSCQRSITKRLSTIRLPYKIIYPSEKHHIPE